MPFRVGQNPSVPQPTPLMGTQPPGAPQTTGGTAGGVRRQAAPGVTAAGRLPNTAATRTTAAQQQPAPDVGIFGRIKAGLTSFKNAITQAFTRPPAPPSVPIPDTVQVTLGTTLTANLPKAQFEPMIKALPQSQRAGAIQTLTTDLQARIDNGRRVLDLVRIGVNQPPASPKNVADLMLLFYAMAAQRNEAFTDGSFSVPDNDGAIANWLDTSSEVYVRSSSHLRAYQGATVDGHLNLQRGIDIPEGVGHGLPNGHRTVLYGTIPDAGHGRRLFLKTEPAGCRINTASSGDIQRAINQRLDRTQLDPSQLGGANPNDRSMHIRDKRLSDVGEFLGHAFSYFATRGQQGISGARKEHFPQAVSDTYKRVTADLGKLAKAQGPTSSAARVLEGLTHGGPAKGGGVCMLLRNIESVRRDFPGQFTDKLNELETAVRSMEHNTDLEIRLGNEMILHF